MPEGWGDRNRVREWASAINRLVAAEITDEMASELVEALQRDWRLVDFSDAWRDLPEAAQLAAARAWLRLALTKDRCS